MSQFGSSSPGRPRYSKYIFDVGNVILRCGIDVFFSKIGIDPAEASFVHRNVITDEFVNRLDRGFDFAFEIETLRTKHSAYSWVIDEYSRNWHKTIGEVDREVVGAIETLRSFGAPTYALSNWPKEKVYLIERAIDTRSLFNDAIYSGRVGVAKPDKKIFELARLQFKIDKESIFIDDKLENVAGAKTAGIASYQFVSAQALKAIVFSD